MRPQEYANTASQTEEAPAKTNDGLADLLHKNGPTGSESLRDHDFPMPGQHDNKPVGPAAIDTGVPPPEVVKGGGQPGTVAGDRQNKGSVGAIFDQDGVDPNNCADR